jgi:NitT/TauT family transport system permease protein
LGIPPQPDESIRRNNDVSRKPQLARGFAPVTFIGTNLMEIVSPHGRGLGALFDSGKTNSDYPLMFAVLIALALLGILLYYIVVALEKTFAGWADRSNL